MRRLLVPTAALLWGLQFSFLVPALALILVTLYGATPADLGWILAVYNASGFVAAIVVPSWADRRGDYLRPLLGCGVLTVALAVLLIFTTSLPVAVIGLVVFGGPAGVGVSLLFAQLRHSGARKTDVVNTRAVVSAAWVAGPPLATFIIAGFGDRAILLAIAAVAVLNVITTAAMMRTPASVVDRAADEPDDEMQSLSRGRVIAVVVAFVLLQATSNAAVSVMTLFVTQSLGLDVVWAGIALGVAAGVEIPALLLIGRLSLRYSSLGLVATGCVAGIAYYAAMPFVTGPAMLIGLQLLNAWFFAAVSGVGITLFLEIIPRPGFAAGLYTNTRRIGSIVSGPVIAAAAIAPGGYRSTFGISALLTGAALVTVLAVSALARRDRRGPAT